MCVLLWLHVEQGSVFVVVELLNFQRNIYKALGDPQQLFLMEVACAQDSVLSSEVEKQGLRAKRCSWWNDYDLSSNEGFETSPPNG